MKTKSFYGREQATVPAITNEYPGIDTPITLYETLKHVWCEYTCAPRLRKEWSRANITLGQCSITAFLVQDIFGGKVYGVLRPGGNYHCYNNINGHVFDLTSEQFGDEVLSYEGNPEQFREVHFKKTEKKERYEYLCKSLKEYVTKRENPPMNMSVSPITHDKNGKPQVFVQFSDGKRFAEGRLPGATIVSGEGFSDEELAALKNYMKKEKATILSMAKKINVMDAFLGKDAFTKKR